MLETPRIFWDSFGLQTLYSGVGQHAFHLNQALLKQGHRPLILPSHPVIASNWHQQLAPCPRPSASWMRLKPLSLALASRQLSQQLQSQQRAVIHGLSNYNLPHVARRLRHGSLRQVLTVHDLIPFLMPTAVSKSLYLYLSWQLPRALQAADAIICVSRWTLDSLEDRFPEVRGRTVLIPNGSTQVPQLERSAVAQPRLLTIARDEPYKRLNWIAAVLEALPPSYHWDLVSDPAGCQRLAQLEVARRGRLRLHAQLSDAALQQLQSAASVYVHPSLLEGYCLPAAQALASGKPVVYTAGSGIDETVAGAGIGLSALAAAGEWAEALVAVNQQLSVWAQRCHEHCRSMPTWDELAARTLKVYGMLG